jgi:hypothetical protein
VYVININYDYGVEGLQEWLFIKRKQRIPYKLIVMGNEAEKTLKKNFKGLINYYKIPHPQAANRFPKYKEQFMNILKDKIL